MKKVWITGAKGHVGSALSKLLDSEKYELFLTDIDEVDITKADEVRSHARMLRPDVIINCAGFTDPLECEENTDRAYQVNAIGVRNIAQAAEGIGAMVIQMSTDDVFSLESDRPYNEFDEINPKTAYGKSKAAGEKFLTSMNSRYVIIRSSWVYGVGRDFVDEVLSCAKSGNRIAVPNNRYACPTSAKELAKVITHFVDNDEYGIYHVVCPGGCSRYDFAKEIIDCAGLTDHVELYPILSDGLMRPNYSVLDNMMLRLSGMPEPIEWKKALREYLTSESEILS